MGVPNNDAKNTISKEPTNAFNNPPPSVPAAGVDSVNNDQDNAEKPFTSVVSNIQNNQTKPNTMAISDNVKAIILINLRRLYKFINGPSSFAYGITLIWITLKQYK